MCFRVDLRVRFGIGLERGKAEFQRNVSLRKRGVAKDSLRRFSSGQFRVGAAVEYCGGPSF